VTERKLDTDRQAIERWETNDERANERK